MPAQTRLFMCRSDNYGVLLHDSATGATASIDAPEAAPIEAALKATGWKLTDILVTHHHADHTDGVVPGGGHYGTEPAMAQACALAPGRLYERITTIDPSSRR